MLLMPRIHRRSIEGFKSNRSLRVHGVEKAVPVNKRTRPNEGERRVVNERRKSSIPVKLDRRRGPRRNARQRLRPEIRKMLENAGNSNAATMRRGGVYIDEDV